MGMPTLVQQEFWFRADDGNETGANFLGSKGSNQSFDVGTSNKFRIRFVVEETAGANASITAALYWQKNGTGGYSPADSTSTNPIKPVGSDYSITDEDTTTNQMGYSGSYQSGRWDDDGTGENAISFNGQYTEVEFCVYLDGTYMADGDYVDLRVYDQSGSPLDSYTVTARATASVPSGYTLSCNGGSYGISGTSVELTRDRLLSASSGAYSVTGSSVTLTHDTPTRYWVGDTDSSWNNANNWASSSGGAGGAGVPTNANDVYFDNQYTTANCTCDVAIDVASLTVVATYDGKLDFADSSYSHAISGNATFDGVGEVDCGNATITCGGNWDNADQTTWVRATSTVVLSGSSKTITTRNSKLFYNLTISGSYTSNGGSALQPTIDGGTLTISGTLSGTGDLSIQDTASTSAAALVVTSAGSVSQDGITLNGFLSGSVSLTIDTGATWSIGKLNCYANVNINATGAGTLTITGNDTFLWQELYNGGKTLKFGAGTFLIGTAATFDQNKSAQTSTIDLVTNNASLIFQNSVTIQEASTLNWSAGTGTITFSGTADQTVTTPDGWTEVLEDIVIDKDNSTAKVTLASDVYTQSFTGTQGRFDLNGNTLFSDGNVDIDTTGGFQFHNGTDNDMSDGVTDGKFDLDGGSLTLDGTSGTHLEIDNLDFDLAAAVTGTATYCDVINSTCTYVTSAIDATAASNTDNGGNTGWNFGSGYTLTALSGSYAFSGTAVNLKRDSVLGVSPGSYAVTGAAAGLNRDLVLSIGAGSYSVSGTATDLLRDCVLTVGSGSYDISGSSVGLDHDRVLSLTSGAYAVTGSNVTLTYSTGYTLTALSGSYAVTGTQSSLLADRKLSASPGAYSLAGTAASLLIDRSISVQPGSYAVSGDTTSLLVDRTLAVGAGSYAVAGTNVGLQHDRNLSVLTGSYSIAGTNANLLYSGAGNYTLTALSGSYSVSGNAAALKADRQLVAQSGAYSLAGAAADLLTSRILVANPGSYVVTGSLVDLRYETGPATPMETGGVQLRAVLAMECELRSALSMDCELKQSLEMEGALI